MKVDEIFIKFFRNGLLYRKLVSNKEKSTDLVKIYTFYWKHFWIECNVTKYAGNMILFPCRVG
jgi:hypothetical protein